MSLRNDAEHAPPVWRWYLAYSLGMAGFLFCMTLAGVVMLALETLPDEALPAIVVDVAICFPLICVYGAVPFLPRKPWAWTYGVVAICAGTTCGCWIAASVPLLVYWLKPETKAYFGRA